MSQALVSEMVRSRLWRGRAAAVRRAGYDLKRLANVPFGVRWEDDVASLLDGRLSLALDVGANEGQTARELLARFPDLRIVSFEPHPVAAERLRTLARQEPRLEAASAAVGAEAGETSLVLTSWSQWATVARPPRAGEETVTVPVVALDGFCGARGIGQVSLLKVDTEGHEMAVLRGAERLLAEQRIQAVVVECEFHRHPEEPHGDFFEIHRLLDGCGYRFIASYTGGVAGDGWRWGDALYVLPSHMDVRRGPFA
jgi:FkbM family methyltransferase